MASPKRSFAEFQKAKDKERNTPEPKKKEETLDAFLGDMFQQTKTGEEGGMPTLDWLKSKFRTKSAAIRYLHDQGHSVNEIRLHLNLRYQHVRNVLKTQLKRGPNEDFKLPT